MAENLETLNTAVSLLIRAALLAARFSGRVRKTKRATIGGNGYRRQSQRDPLPQRQGLPTRNAGGNPSETGPEEGQEARNRDTKSVRGF